MRKDGLVSPEDEGGSGDDRKVYRITPAGEAELVAWLSRPPLRARPLRDELFVRLGLLLLRDPAGAVGLIGTQRQLYHAQLAELTRQKIGLLKVHGPDRLRQELLLDAALLHTEADLKWLETCEAKLQVSEEE